MDFGFRNSLATRLGLGALSLAAALVVAAPAAQATVVTAITPGDGWHVFDVTDFTGSGWIDLNDNSPLSFKFTLTQAALLTVVDAAFAGDAFEVFDNGVSIGHTPTVPNSYPVSNGLNFDDSLASNDYSHAVFLLAAGDHEITGLLSTSIIVDGFPLNTTVGAMKLDALPGSEVPLPGALPLFVSGLAALGLVARNRRRKIG